MMAKLAIFDKDNTLVNSTAANGFINHPDQQIIRPKSLEIVKTYLDNDYILCVASNQGGVEKKHKSLQSAIDEMIYCNNLYVQALNSPVFERFYFCPDFDGNICYLGEPRGYAKNAQNWKCQLEDVVMIGDRPEDEQAANNAGIKFRHIESF